MSGPSPGQRAGQSHSVVAWSFVAVQAALLIAVVATPRGDDWAHAGWLDAVAFCILALGVALGLWSALRLGRGLTPSPLPNGAVDLVTRGPYRWVRHPMYTAVMLIVAGVTIRSGSVVVLAEAVALVILFNVKARWEEHRLDEAFPGYRDHEAVTGRFLPARSRSAGSRANS
jgi:protein-S-isoprenylcysteine O-methyltransferase Ste14